MEINLRVLEGADLMEQITLFSVWQVGVQTVSEGNYYLRVVCDTYARRNLAKSAGINNTPRHFPFPSTIQ